MSLSDYHTMDDAYSFHRILATFQEVPVNEEMYDYRTQATLIDDDGNQYNFDHTHSDDLLHGRPLVKRAAECPRENSILDPVTGECADVCSLHSDCALGYSCRDGHCLRDTCKVNSDCTSQKCENQVCQPVRCDQEFQRQFYVSDEIGANFTPRLDTRGSCVSTSHYHLQRNSAHFPLDERYRGMY